MDSPPFKGPRGVGCFWKAETLSEVLEHVLPPLLGACILEFTLVEERVASLCL